MNPRVEYEMSEADLRTLLDACRPTIAIMVGGIAPPTPQENANRAWADLGRKMGFDSLTVRPIEGRGLRWFSAVPSETNDQREDRVKREEEERRRAEIAKHEEAIAQHQAALSKLRP